MQDKCQLDEHKNNGVIMTLIKKFEGANNNCSTDGKHHQMLVKGNFQMSNIRGIK